MDCMDCHNRPDPHLRAARAGASTAALAEGAHQPRAALREEEGGRAAARRVLRTRTTAARRIARGPHGVLPERASPQAYASTARSWRRRRSRLAAIYARNVFPEMKVGWGTYPNNIGHEDFLGCFRCHDDIAQDARRPHDHAGLQRVPHASWRMDEADPEGALRPGPAVAALVRRCCSLALRPAGRRAADADCLACHGEKELRSDAGREPVRGRRQACRRASTARSRAATATRASTDCPHPEPKPPKVELLELPRRRRGRAREERPRRAATAAAGRARLLVLPRRTSTRSCRAATPARRLAQGATCRRPAARATPTRTSWRGTSSAFARPVEAYERSVHGRALARGNDKAASCSDCHGAHAIGKRARDTASRDQPLERAGDLRRAATREMRDAYAASVHGQAVARGRGGRARLHRLPRRARDPGARASPARSSTRRASRA